MYAIQRLDSRNFPVQNPDIFDTLVNILARNVVKEQSEKVIIRDLK